MTAESETAGSETAERETAGSETAESETAGGVSRRNMLHTQGWGSGNHTRMLITSPSHRSISGNALGTVSRPKVGDLVKVTAKKDERHGLEGRVVEDDGSDQPFRLEFVGEPGRSDGNEDWFALNEINGRSGIYYLCETFKEMPNLTSLKCAK